MKEKCTQEPWHFCDTLDPDICNPPQDLDDCSCKHQPVYYTSDWLMHAVGHGQCASTTSNWSPTKTRRFIVRLVSMLYKSANQMKQCHAPTSSTNVRIYCVCIRHDISHNNSKSNYNLVLENIIVHTFW